MRIDERVQDTFVVIGPKGRLTAETEAHFTETIRRYIEAGRTRVLLDMSGVSALDCRGLGALVKAHVAVRDGGGELKLLNLTSRSRHMLTVTKLLTVLCTCDTEADAERSFRTNRHPSFQQSWSGRCHEGLHTAAESCRFEHAE